MQPFAHALRQIGLDEELIRTHTVSGGDLRFFPRANSRGLTDPHPAAGLFRLFVCGMPQDRTELPGFALAFPWLVEDRPGRIRSELRLDLAAGLYLFSDPLGSRPDAVMGPGSTTALLYRASRPEGRVGRVLDLGCGAGTLALLLADCAEEAAGTDINPRALRIASFNAEANGIARVSFRCGNLFDATPGERFDLIVSQPPYYPGAGDVFLYGGAGGDELAMTIIDQVCDHLAPHGEARIFAAFPDHRQLAAPRHADLLEIWTRHGEIPETRQSLVAIRHGGGRVLRFEAAPECWHLLNAARIHELEQSLDLDPACPLELAGPAQVLEQTPDRTVVRFAPETLLGTRVLESELWNAWTDPASPRRADGIRMGLFRRKRSPSGLLHRTDILEESN